MHISFSSLALEYKLYYSDDWRNLEETLLYKILPSTLHTAHVIPKASGDEELEEFQLHGSSLPMIYYIALKAIDKSGNEGKLSNIVQVLLMNVGIPWGNETYRNETKNDTCIASILDQDSVVYKRYWYIFIGCASAFIFILIAVNILIWACCFRKYKTKNKGSKMENVYKSKHQRAGKDLNSDKSILQGEGDDSNKYEQSPKVKSRDNASENIDRSNPLIIYAQVDRSSTNKKHIRNTEIKKTQHKLNHKESDLGFV